MSKLGIIAGGGEAPKRLIAACRKLNRPFAVLALEGQADPDIENNNTPVTWLPLGAAQAAIDLGRQNGVREVIWLGRIKRPTLASLRPDGLLFKKLFRLAPYFFMGDDRLLKAVAHEFDIEGFRVVAPQDVFKDLLMPAGTLGSVKPDEAAKADIKAGIEAARGLGVRDKGQAAVVQNGAVLALENAEHTDALIRRAAGLKKPGRGPVLVKMAKPQQDKRFDLPSLGVDTVKEAIAGGFSGIAAEAGASLLIDRDDVVRLADSAGLFIVGVGEHG